MDMIISGDILKEKARVKKEKKRISLAIIANRDKSNRPLI